MNTVVGRMDANDEIFKRILDDPNFRDLLADFYVRKVYERVGCTNSFGPRLRAGGADG